MPFYRNKTKIILFIIEQQYRYNAYYITLKSGYCYVKADAALGPSGFRALEVKYSESCYFGDKRCSISLLDMFVN